jgi:hypothetical protein
MTAAVRRFRCDADTTSLRMIRYVLAVLLTTALLGVGFAALQEVAAVRGETQVEGEIADIERAAVSLLAHDDPAPAGENPPRRVLDLDLPSGGFASEPVETLVFEPVAGTNRTAVRYRFDGRSVSTVYLDAPLVNAADGPPTLNLSGSAGSRTVVLELLLDGDRRPVVQMTVRERSGQQ